MLTDQIARARISDWQRRADRAAAYRRVVVANQTDKKRRDLSLRRRTKRQRFAANSAIEA